MMKYSNTKFLHCNDTQILIILNNNHFKGAQTLHPTVCWHNAAMHHTFHENINVEVVL